MNTMKEVNDQQKEMALKKKIYLLPVPALLLCLYLAACSSLVDTRSFDSAGDDGLAYHDGDGEGLTEATIVTATSEKFYEEHPELVKAFLTAQEQVLDKMDADHAAAVAATAKATGLEEAAVEEMYGLYDFDMEIKDSDIEAMEKNNGKNSIDTIVELILNITS